MQHFLEISHLTSASIYALLEKALAFKQAKQYPCYKDHVLATLFYEPSTRTRTSFALAARRLGMEVLDIASENSAQKKGESLEDTIHTLYAMGVQYFVIRHVQNGLPAALALQTEASIVNAGDGTHAHPSQAMLDLMTVWERKPHLHALKIVIVGDVRHSRVAHSWMALCHVLGMPQPILAAPDVWAPEQAMGTFTTNLENGLRDADVVIVLRIQQERLQAEEALDLDFYQAHYTVTEAALQLASPDALVLHPGPVNRNIEISSAVVDGAHSVILTQVQNGVFMRMAILETLIGGRI